MAIKAIASSVGATAQVGGVGQVSGTTGNDFSSPVTYTVTAEDGTTTSDWTVPLACSAYRIVVAFVI